MKFFKKRSVAVVVLVLAILASCAYGLYKKPADQLNVQYGTWLLDGAGCSPPTPSRPSAIITRSGTAATAPSSPWRRQTTSHGWTAEKYAKTLGKSWGLGANDMLLLIVKGGDYYVALGDTINQSLTDTQIAKLQSAIETPYYQGDCDGAATAFFRQADVVLAQVMQSGGSSYSGGYSESYNGGWVDSSGASVSSVIVLIIAIFVIWVRSTVCAIPVSAPYPRRRAGDPVLLSDLLGPPETAQTAPPPPRGPRGGPRRRWAAARVPAAHRREGPHRPPPQRRQLRRLPPRRVRRRFAPRRLRWRRLWRGIPRRPRRRFWRGRLRRRPPLIRLSYKSVNSAPSMRMAHCFFGCLGRRWTFPVKKYRTKVPENENNACNAAENMLHCKATIE